MSRLWLNGYGASGFPNIMQIYFFIVFVTFAFFFVTAAVAAVDRVVTFKGNLTAESIRLCSGVDQ